MVEKVLLRRSGETPELHAVGSYAQGYRAGNFVFLQGDPWTRLSAILQIVVTPNRRLRLSAIPIRVGHQPTLATGAAADSVHARLRVPLSTTTLDP